MTQNQYTYYTFTQYVGALMQFQTASAKIAWSESEVSRMTRNLLPLAEFMARQNKKHTGTHHIEKHPDQHYEIKFHNVSFSYPGKSTMILKNVTAKINPKNKLAVVGPNGAGKTTFIKLMCRLYDPAEDKRRKFQLLEPYTKMPPSSF